MCKRPHLAPSHPHFGSQHSLDTTMGAVEVQSLGYYTVYIVYMSFVRFGASGCEVNFFFNFETEDISQGELFFTLGKVLAM